MRSLCRYLDACLEEILNLREILEWKLAQQHVVENNPENSLPKPDQISPHYSNGERVKMITVFFWFLLLIL